MAKTIAKTFRLPPQVVQEIEREAKNNHVSQAEYIVAVFTENKLLKLQKTFLEDVKNMEGDKIYQQEQKDLAESSFL